MSDANKISNRLSSLINTPFNKFGSDKADPLPLNIDPIIKHSSCIIRR